MLATIAIVVVACGAGSGGTPLIDVDHTEHASSALSTHVDTTPLVIVATDAATQARLVGLVRGLPPAAQDRVLVAAFQGQQRTGGYAIRITKIVRVDNVLEVRAAFEAPPPDAITIQVITSPVHVVSVPRGQISGVVRVRLLDADGKERASGTL